MILKYINLGALFYPIVSATVATTVYYVYCLDSATHKYHSILFIFYNSLKQNNDIHHIAFVDNYNFIKTLLPYIAHLHKLFHNAFVML